MGRKPLGEHALTKAERQVRVRAKKHTQLETWRKALEEIATMRPASVALLRRVAIEALSTSKAPAPSKHRCRASPDPRK